MSHHHRHLENFASRGLKAQTAVDKVLKNLPASDPNAGGSQDATAGRLETTAPRVLADGHHGGGAGETPAVPGEKLKALNSMPLINRTHVRNFLLEFARATRPANKFNRVSEETLREIHEAVRQMLMARVHRTPSKGRTM
jgi:hypothetical protein